jgi:hypothetical protein
MKVEVDGSVIGYIIFITFFCTVAFISEYFTHDGKNPVANTFLQT